MPDDVLVDDSVARAALDKYAMTPYPGTKFVCPESLTILDQLVGTAMNDILIDAEADETRSGEELSRVAFRLRLAGDALLELMGPVLETHVERVKAGEVSEQVTNSEVSAFSEQDKMDLDIVFSVARDAMRALGWNEVVISDFNDLQYRLRVATGVQ